MSVAKHTLVVVVNGTEVKVKAEEDKPLGDIIPEALREANVTGEAEAWDLKDENGKLFDSSALLSSFSLPAEAVLYLNLRRGGEAGH